MKAPAFDTLQAQRFLRALHPKGLGGHRLEFRLVGNNGQGVRRGFVASLSQVPWAKLSELNAQGFNVYFGPALRQSNGGTKADAAAIPALWVDLDERRFSEKRGAFKSLAALPPELHPSAIVDSGHGLHGWWLLENPVVLTDANRADMEAILRGLQHTVGSDAVHDVGRCMRVPGSVNVKDPADPRPCRLVSFSAERRFDLAAFQHLAAERPPSDFKAEPVEFSATLPKVTLSLLRISPRLRKLVKMGWQRGGEYPSRSEADQAVVTGMRKAAHTPDEIKAVFEKAEWGIGAKYREILERQEPERADRYLARCIQHADEFLAVPRAEQDPNGPAILWAPSVSPPDLGKVREVVMQAFPELWPATQAVLAAPAAMLPDDVVNPPTLMIEGASAGGKTTLLDFVDGTPYLAYRTDKFTPKAFVTHAVNVAGEHLSEIDLLPRIRFRAMLTGELSPLFRGREEDLTDSFSMLTAVLDGRGLMSDSGSRGRRGYEGDYLFSWLGATTPLPSRTWRIMQQLGARLLFYWLWLPVPEVDEIVANLVGPQAYKEKVAACKAAVNEFLLALFRSHGRKGQERPFGITWRRADDPVGVITQIAMLADLGAQCRGVVSVWQDDQGQINFHPPNIEQPHRFAALLYNLARGHALVHGRTRLSPDDLPTVTRVALDSMPLERRKILRLLIAAGPGLSRSSTDVKRSLGCSKPTALRLIREMGLLEIAQVFTDPHERDEGDRPTLRIALPERLAWLATPEVQTALDLPAEGDADLSWEPGADDD